MTGELSYPKEKIKILLFEKIHRAADEAFSDAGYRVERVEVVPDDAELTKLLADAHIVGVRSRTKIRAEMLASAKRLLGIGCFSVGTDQVDLAAAAAAGVPVFNAPHSSTRSVAELAMANVFSLSRRLADRSGLMHAGKWKKSAARSFEIRNKMLGIVGYGHIGQQVGLLAEAVGMEVLFYDIEKKLALGRARSVSSLDALLEQSDFVTLHVPGGDDTTGMISAEQLRLMKPGAYLLNLSRGLVVDIASLCDALRQGHLAGAALDVYPEEPGSADASFESELCGLDNVILTPHVGGSTLEAQRNIGREVAIALTRFLDNGSSRGAVNFPQVHLPTFPDSHRILLLQKNVPGALSAVNHVTGDLGVNIDAQYLSSDGPLAYLIMDINSEASDELRRRLAELPETIRTRMLY